VVDSNKLKAVLIENGFTQEAMANKLDIATFTLNEKINNKREFTASEMRGIKRECFLSNDRFMVIFFPEECESCSH